MVDAIVSILLDKVVTFLLSEGQQLLDFDDKFNKIRNELRYMQSYLKEVQMVKRKHRNEVLKTATGDLRELIYDVEDVVADCQCLLMKQQRGCLLNFMCYFSPKRLRFRYNITTRLTVIDRGIEGVKERMRSYLATAPVANISREGGSNQQLRYPISIDDANVTGLEDDSAKVQGWIMEANEPFMVIGIVGMGGIGKTTLAYKICDSDNVKHTFQPIIDVTVSQNCELEELLKQMLKKMEEEESSLWGKEVGELLTMVKSKLQDKKYLLFLDDVWGRDDGHWWESLNSALPKRNGSCVIVTTRKLKVARSMRATDEHIHQLRVLSNDDSWSLFTKVAFVGNSGRCPNLELECLGKEIVKRCRGLPLAIKVVGGMMLEIGNSVDEWKRISEHVKEELEENNKDEPVMSSLELSYEELPVHLKPCFLCFSMYPEDYKISITEIIGWWIGEGFVSARNGESSFEVGRAYITELMNRCLLTGCNIDMFERTFNCCRLHDMVRDMVIKIARDENFVSLDKYNRPVFDGRSRRGFTFGNSKSESIRSKEVKKLRALAGWKMEEEFVLNIKVKLCDLKWLRVIRLQFPRTTSDATAFGKDWLDGIGSLLHLVDLRIWNCSLETLPDSIGDLYNLQFLVLWNWPNLKMLPPATTKLNKLVYVSTGCCSSLECFPDGFARISKLERLFGFKPTSSSHENASRVCQLKSFSRLRELWIDFENPNQLEDGELNVLSELQHLQILSISFKVFYDDEISDAVMSKLNHQLSPLPSLEELLFVGLPGESTPVWLNPASLPSLRFLGFQGGKLRHMEPGFWEGECGVWKIEVLVLKKLRVLEEEWARFQKAMPSLRKVRVIDCPGLKSFPIDVSAGMLKLGGKKRTKLQHRVFHSELQVQEL